MSDKLTNEQLDESSNRLNQFRALIDSDYEGAKLYLAVLASDAIPALIAELRELRKLRDEVERRATVHNSSGVITCHCVSCCLARDILAHHFGKESHND